MINYVEVFFKVIHFHPEVLAVLLAMIFAIAQAKFAEYLFSGTVKESFKRKAITACHIVLATIIYSHILWSLLDHDTDSDELVWVISIGCAFIAAVIYVYFKEISGFVLGAWSHTGSTVGTIVKWVASLFKKKPTSKKRHIKKK